jgi:hypothetical protein
MSDAPPPSTPPADARPRSIDPAFAVVLAGCALGLLAVFAVYLP